MSFLLSRCRCFSLSLKLHCVVVRVFAYDATQRNRGYSAEPFKELTLDDEEIEKIEWTVQLAVSDRAERVWTETNQNDKRGKAKAKRPIVIRKLSVLVASRDVCAEQEELALHFRRIDVAETRDASKPDY